MTVILIFLPEQPSMYILVYQGCPVFKTMLIQRVNFILSRAEKNPPLVKNFYILFFIELIFKIYIFLSLMYLQPLAC